MTTSPLLVEHHDAIAVLTLNRPERRNALGVALVEALEQEIRRLDCDPGTRVIVLAAAPPGFCAGADLKEFGDTDITTMCQQDARTAALAPAKNCPTRTIANVSRSQ